MKQCIENPNDVDWLGFWAERLEGKNKKTGIKLHRDFIKEPGRTTIRMPCSTS